MRVLVSAISSACQLSGVQRHAFNLVHCLLMLPEVSGVDLALAPWQCKLAESYVPDAGHRLHLHFPHLANTPVARNTWFYEHLAALARDLSADLVHVAYPVPLRRAAFHCPVVATLHDLYPYQVPRNFGLAKAWVNRRVLQQCLRNLDAVVCVSDATAIALRAYTPPHIWQKASRIYNCVQLPSHDVQPENVIHGSSPFLLCVAQHRRNKNIPLAVECFRSLLQRKDASPDLKLLIVGIGGPETSRILRHVALLGLTDRVTLVEGLSDEALLWCYRHCIALLMPSLSEGFGLPAVEALMAGCRVICSDIPALREVCGGHCQCVPVTEDGGAAFALAVVKALEQPVPAPLRFPQFSPTEIAHEYLTLYSDVIASSAASRHLSLRTQIHSAASERSAL